MKIALHLFVVIAAFALQESAAAGLLGGILGGVTKIVDTTVKGVGNIVSPILNVPGTVKEKPKETNKNVISKVEETNNKNKQQIQKLEKALGSTALQNKLSDTMVSVFNELEGNWKELRAKTEKNVTEIMKNNLKGKSKLEDVKPGVSSALKVLATETAEKVKCDETEKAEFQNKLYTNLESIAEEWYKTAQ